MSMIVPSGPGCRPPAVCVEHPSILLPPWKPNSVWWSRMMRSISSLALRMRLGLGSVRSLRRGPGQARDRAPTIGCNAQSQTMLLSAWTVLDAQNTHLETSSAMNACLRPAIEKLRWLFSLRGQLPGPRADAPA